ncbi:hypothetical protein FRC04_009158, partial [Tulasnella sp. 424]
MRRSRDWKGGRPAAPANKKARTDGGLFDVKWKRILLDEGHNIRNPKTKTSQAICELVVTGTPIINSPNDLGSLLKFLKVCSLLDQHEYFNRLLGRPLSKADPQAAVLLKALMSSICLRKEMRDKDHKPLVPLPPVGITVVRVALSDEERRLYDDIFHESQRRFEDFLSAGNAMHQPAGDVWTLVRSKDMRNDTNKMLYLQGPPKANNKNDAAAHPPSPALSAEEVDQGVVSEGDLIESPPPSPEDDFEVDEEADYDALDNDEAFKPPPPPPPSSKTQHLISLLQLIPSTEKSLVFSQFTSFLDQIAIQYLAKYPMLDSPSKRKGKGKGRSSAFSRTVSQVPVVMLISPKAGALGLNLAAASRVFL